MTPSIWNFDTTGECYDDTQTRDEIKDGDVLIVRPTELLDPFGKPRPQDELEAVVGFLFEAWPIAVTAEHGELHGIKITRDEWLAKYPAYAESWELAESWACGYGLPLAH